MAKRRSVFECTECGAQQPRYLGRCPDCGGWGCLVEEALGGGSAPDPLSPTGALGAESKPQALGEVEVNDVPRLGTGVSELDRVLGGGAVPGGACAREEPRVPAAMDKGESEPEPEPEQAQAQEPEPEPEVRVHAPHPVASPPAPAPPPTPIPRSPIRHPLRRPMTRR